MEKTSIQPSCTDAQISVWLRALLSLAWADGDFDQAEQQLVASITHHELTVEESARAFQPVTSEELVTAFGQDPKMAENFLKTAVMVALADGSYTSKEDDLLHQFCQALQYPTEILETLRLTLTDRFELPARDRPTPPNSKIQSAISLSDPQGVASPPDHLLNPLRVWLDSMEIHDPKVAHFLCKMIPPQCPFERDVKLFGHKVVHIPPLCKLNPLYEQLVGLRFRSLSYLADDCGEDVSTYC
jgi:tellurite resistance protein